LLWVGLSVILSCLTILLPQTLAESATPPPQIIISQIKITSSNGQFITLYNNTNGTIDLATIQLQYFNSYDLLDATSGKLISLSGKVPAHGYIIVNDGPVQVCYQMVVDSVSLGLSTSKGMIQVGHLTSDKSPQFISVLDDYIAWAKPPSSTSPPLPSGVAPLPTSTGEFLQRQPLDGQNAPRVGAIGEGFWLSAQQPDGSSLCNSGPASVGNGNQLLAATPPPPNIISTSSGANLPAVDAGLAAPQLSEILPNPAPPLSDATDEFVELYNPNDARFDLSGFALQAGISTTHNYIFPSGQFILQPHEFRAFYASQTSLTLSNDTGQVKLLDPSGNVLSESDAYMTAKDGYARVYANGSWQWTTTPTPSAANIINAPPAAKKSATASKTTKTASKTAVKSAKTTAKPKVSNGTPPSAVTAVGNLHPLVLAGVGTLALLYALYEYRHDLANTFHRIRRNRAAG